MINKISGWDELEVKEESISKSLPIGNYIVRIKSVEDVPSKEYLKVYFDISDGQYAGYFTKLAQLNGGVWSNQGIKYASYKETCGKFFRGFITAVEKSNVGFVWNWDEKSLVGKTFVAVFGEEEYIATDGTIKTSVKLRDCHSIEFLKSGKLDKLPTLKKLPAAKPNPVQDTAFPDVPSDNIDLPF